MSRFLVLPLVALLSATPLRAAEFDVLVRGGTVYDGSGGPPKRADVGLRGDTIAAIGDLSADTAKTVIDARGLAVAPGFINMLSWSTDAFMADGRGQSEVRQGVTTQIMGEGSSMGPVDDRMKARMKRMQTKANAGFRYQTSLVFPRPGTILPMRLAFRVRIASAASFSATIATIPIPMLKT